MPTVVRGVAIRPTVSANRRRYKAETLRKAHDRLAARLADPAGQPVTMRTFHPRPSGADADVTAIAGRVTKVNLTDEGAIAYEAVLNDTDGGRTAATLTKPDAEGRQHLANVSIRGYALGPVTKDADGNDTFDDLEIVGLDLTDDPGVKGATIAAAQEALDVATETADRHFVVESVDSAVITEAAAVTPGASDYADPGYQKDGKKRYPVDTKAHALAAWSYINKTKNADAYTGNQLKRIKTKIKAALKRFGVDVSDEAYTPGSALNEATFTAFVEEASASISVGNGPTHLNVSTYGADPANLKDLIAKHAAAAHAALDALDPDADGDVDSDDDADEPLATGPGWESATHDPAAPAAATEATASDPAQEESVPEETAPITPATEAAPVTADTVKEAVAAANAPLVEALGALTAALTPKAPAAEAAPAAPAAPETPAAPAAPATSAAETAPPETAEQIEARIRNELLNAARSEGVERNGLVRDLSEADFDITKLSANEQNALFAEALTRRFARMSPTLALSLEDAEV